MCFSRGADEARNWTGKRRGRAGASKCPEAVCTCYIHMMRAGGRVREAGRGYERGHAPNKCSTFLYILALSTARARCSAFILTFADTTPNTLRWAPWGPGKPGWTLSKLYRFKLEPWGRSIAPTGLILSLVTLLLAGTGFRHASTGSSRRPGAPRHVGRGGDGALLGALRAVGGQQAIETTSTSTRRLSTRCVLRPPAAWDPAP